jgi:flagellar biosynthetic protein FliP
MSRGQHRDPRQRSNEEEVMTVIHATRPTWRAAVTNRAFILRYLQILSASIVGMVVLGPLSMRVGASAGAEVNALLMATTMTAGLAAWMAWRRYMWPAIAEMGLAMYLSFVVLFPLYWLGVLSAMDQMILGHVLMVPAIAVAMLRRREEYVGRH